MPVLLVIDDEPAILHAFRRGFQKPDVTLLTAASAAEGLAMVAQHQPDVVQADFGQQMLESQAAFDTGSTAALVLIDHQDAFTRPAPFHRPALQGILQRSGFAMLQHLMGAGLTNVHDRPSLTMLRLNFGRSYRLRQDIR